MRLIDPVNVMYAAFHRMLRCEEHRQADGA